MTIVDPKAQPAAEAPPAEAEVDERETVDEALAKAAGEEAEAVGSEPVVAIEAAEGPEGEPGSAPVRVLDLVERAEGFTAEQVQSILESLLLISEAPLTLEVAREACGVALDRLSEAFAALAQKYAAGRCGMNLVEIGGAWQLRTDPANSELVRRLLRVKPLRLTRAALETLAIVAYRQPVTRPEVEEVRGVDCGAVIKALLERKLVRILGKKEEPGRPLLYGTTREFLEFFGLKDLKSLPTLREFAELSEEHREIVEKETGAEVKPIEGLVAALSDQGFEARLAESHRDSEEALDFLEVAMDEAEKKSKLMFEQLNPPQPPQANSELAEAAEPDSDAPGAA